MRFLYILEYDKMEYSEAMGVGPNQESFTYRMVKSGMADETRELRKTK